MQRPPGSSIGVRTGTASRDFSDDDEERDDQTYKPVSDDELFSDDEEETPAMQRKRLIETPVHASSHAKKARKTKNTQMIEMLQGRNHLISELIKDSRKKPDDDHHTEDRKGSGGISIYVKKWAEILASRVDRMPKGKAERFMHTVDGQALDILLEDDD